MEPTLEDVLNLLDSSDRFTAMNAIQSSDSPREIGTRYEKLVLDLYWKAKNLPAVVEVAKWGLRYCLETASDPAHPDAAALLDSAKKMAYNLASFCWPGWDEPGITITPADVKTGAETAKLNLRLATELNRPPKGMSMARWLLGAYDVAQQRYADAVAQFTRARDFSAKANDPDGVTFNEGYAALARLGQKDLDAEAEFARNLENLESRGTDDSKEYARQLRVARAVFRL